MNEAAARVMISRPPHNAARAACELSGAANSVGMPICTSATRPM